MRGTTDDPTSLEEMALVCRSLGGKRGVVGRRRMGHSFGDFMNRRKLQFASKAKRIVASLL